MVVAMVLSFGMTVIGCDDGTGTGTETGTGANLGIIAFGDSRVIQPIQLLTTRNSNQFNKFIDGLVMEDGTGLYLAVDQAITMLTKAKFPRDLSNVAIVTFTDGLDNVSLHNPHSSHAAWQSYLSNRIANTKIQGLNIDAYSIGIRGNDVTDTATFTAGLEAIASAPKNVSQVTSMTAVTNTFKQIADSLHESNTSNSILLRIPIGYESGTTMRFTFDITNNSVTNPLSSSSYIEGTFTVNNAVFSLTGVNQVGLTHSSGESITGVRSGNFVIFTFNNVLVTGPNIYLDRTRHWYRNPQQTVFGRNVEFNPGLDSETTVTKSSAVVVLVLDRTTSLGQTNFNSMKSSAKNFVNILAQ